MAVTHNSPRPALSAANSKSHPVTRLFPPPISKILIANPRLEFLPTQTKQTPLTFSNREYIALFQIFSRRQSQTRPRASHSCHIQPADSQCRRPACSLRPGCFNRTGSFDSWPRLPYRRHPCRRFCRFLSSLTSPPKRRHSVVVRFSRVTSHQSRVTTF